jgi:cardiolipin synthase
VTVPNAITFVRLGLVPVFAALFLLGEPGWALATFVAAALSDGLDGLLARVLDQRTELGAILDPVADKALGFVALLLLVLAGDVPAWLLALALLRDVVVIATGVSARLRGQEIHAAPTRLSKYATFGEMTLITLALVERASAAASLAPFRASVSVITGECLLVATGQYLLRLRRVLRGARELV